MTPAIGLALREENRVVLDEPALSAVEVTFERANDDLRIENYVGGMDFDYVSVHALKLSPASADPPKTDYLDAVRRVADENGADSISDHLGFTRDGDDGVELGHFSVPPFTSVALDVTCENIEIIQNYFGERHFFIENIAYLFQFDGEMSEAEFLNAVLARTGCGWLLDVTNVYANALNHRYDAYEFIRSVMPSAGRVQIHLAGGFFEEDGIYIDSHSHPIPKEVWELYEFALMIGRGKVDAVFIERDQNFPDESGWRGEVRKARDLAERQSVTS
ncbi:MAG: DUF692 family protein [Phycisphaerales bacterium]|nr:DUF692 family protein [Phycisphaerales bacterium]